MKRHSYFLPLILLALSSCITTDFVDEPLGPVPARFELSHSSLMVLEGESQQLSAQVIASDGSVLTASVNFISRNPAIASVDPDGLLMAVSAGEVWIDVLTTSLEDSLLVTVEEDLGPVPARIDLSHSSIILLEGESQQLSAQVIASDESVLMDVPVEWSSRDPSIASVDADGLLMAVAAGQVWIDISTTTLKDSLLATVSVDPSVLAEISITSSRSDLFIGDTLQFQSVLRNASGAILTDKEISWTSTNPSICTVNEDGVVLALAEGETQIIASSEGVNSLPAPLMVMAPADTITRMGSFQGLNGYNVKGTATLMTIDGESTLMFDPDFQSSNGPGLYVYLSPNATNVSGGVKLEKLQATSGMQTYAIPANVNPQDFDHVLIYCQPFGAPFGTATFE
ncbi:MAG: DM13 domain-containing protein [Bacteroidota bacterium]